MKKSLKLISLLSLILLLTAFTATSPESLIVGKWKLDVDASKANFEKGFVPSDNPDNDKVAMTMINYVFESLAEAVFEYKENGETLNTVTREKADGTMTTKTNTGTWQISKDGKELKVTENGVVSEFTIVSISAEKLELTKKEKKGNLPLVFVPVK